MVDKIPTLRWDTTEAILNYIRSQNTNAYQSRIPVATDKNIDKVVDQIFDYRVDMNEFTTTLVNRIGTTFIRAESWTNILAEFKKGMLTAGKTIQEIMSGLVKSYAVNHDAEYDMNVLFGTHQPLTLANYHTVNREEVYPITVDEYTLRRAFIDPGGLAQFVQQFVAAPVKSNNWDEFLLTCGLFSKYHRNGGFWRVHSPDVAAADSTQADAKQLLRQLRAMADTMVVLSTRYNAAHMPVSATKDDLVIFVSPEVNAALDVEAFASLFNVDYAAVKGRVIVVPKERFGIDGVQAIMTTRDYFQIWDEVLESTQNFNAANLRTNYILNVRQIISCSTFVPAVMFWTGEGDDELIISPIASTIGDIVVRDVFANIITTTVEGATTGTVERASVYSLTVPITTSMPNEPGLGDAAVWSYFPRIRG